MSTLAKSKRGGFQSGARAALWLLLLLNMFNYIDRQILAAVVPYLKSEFFAPGLDHGWLVNKLLAVLSFFVGAKNPENTLMGALAMAFMLSYMVMAPVFGALRLRRWSLVGLSAALWSIFTGLCGMATSFSSLLVRRAAVGIGEAGYGPIAPTLLADYYGIEERGRILSWFYVAIPVGSAIGYIVGGFIAAHFGWRMAFYAVVPPGLLMAAVAFFMREPKFGAADAEHQSAVEQPRLSLFATYSTLLRNPSYVLCTLGMAAMTFAIGGIAFWMPDYVHTVRGVADLASVNITFGVILVIAGIGGTLFGGRLSDFLRERIKGAYFAVSGVAMLVGFPCWLLMLWVPFPYAWIFVFLGGFCLFFNTGPTNTILVNVTQPAIRAQAMAVNIFIIHALGDVISPLAIGAISDATGSMNTAFAFVSIMVLVGGVLWLFGMRFLAADTSKVTPNANVGQ